jgi:hypothetical protein
MKKEKAKPITIADKTKNKTDEYEKNNKQPYIINLKGTKNM